MARGVDLVYDRLVAAGKLTSSDKYEQLAAVTFFIVSQQTTIHDMWLRGSSGEKHQIDAVIGDDQRRVLIECKDYDKPVGLPLVRNFFGAVEDLNPDEAFIVTTERFTKPAIGYAGAKNIRLAILRPPGDEDWGNVVKSIHISINLTVPVGYPTIKWKVDEVEFERVNASDFTPQTRRPDELQLEGQSGEWQSFNEIWEQIDKKIPAGFKGVIDGTVDYPEPRRLRLDDGIEMKVNGFDWEVEMTTVPGTQVSIGFGTGGLTAELMLRTLDGSIHRIFSNRQLAAFTIDEKGHVIPKSGS